MAGLLVAGLLLLVLYRWSRYRRSPCYQEQLRAQERVLRCQEALQQWTRVASEVESYLARASELEVQAGTALADRVMGPRRSAMLAVENLRQFKGIGRDTVGLLQANGYVSAERIDKGILRIPGIGPARAERILAAAQQLRAAAAALMPNEEERAAIDAGKARLREQYAAWSTQLTALKQQLAVQVAQRKEELEAQRQVAGALRGFTFLRYLLSPRRAEAKVKAFLEDHPTPEAANGLPPVVPGPPDFASMPIAPTATRRDLQLEGAVLPGPGLFGRFVEVKPAASGPTAAGLRRPGDSSPPQETAGRAQDARPTRIRVRWKSSSQFIQDSLRYRTAATQPAAYVPFQQYWPTFASMSQEQLAYYRWWRTEWLAGRKVPVDPSYIFVFVYELLNCSFEEDPFKAYRLLCRLFESYREEQPVLWQYAEWVGDMAWELRLDDEAIAWYSRDDTTYDVALSLAWDRGTRVFTVPVLMTSFGLKPSTHFQRHAEELTELLETALADAEEWCRNNLKRPLLDALSGGKAMKATRDLYRSAVIERQLMRSGPEFTIYRGTPAVRAGVQALFRVVENLHREATGVGRKLQVELGVVPQPLVEHLVARLKQQLRRSTGQSAAQPAAQPTIRFDPSVLAALHQDSAVVQSLLASVLSQETGADGERPMPQPTPEPQPQRAPNLANLARFPSLDSLFTRGPTGGMGELFAALEPDQVEFLRLFRDGQRVDKAVAMQFVRTRGALFVSFVDRINEAALEAFGDNLLEETDDEVRVAEPFMAQFAEYWREREVR